MISARWGRAAGRAAPPPGATPPGATPPQPAMGPAFRAPARGGGAPPGGDTAGGSIPPQLAMELALSRRDVERVYLSRRRFTGRFLATLEEAQKRKAEKGSDRMKSGWSGEVADELRDRKSGVVDE